MLRARAALSQPEPEEPTDEELLELMPETMRDEFSYAAKICSDATGGQVKPRIFRVCLNTAALEFARAVLARWGRPTQQPAEALAARPLLEQVARMGDCIGAHTVAEISTISDRARTWLQENPPGQPVAIEPRGCPIPGACACVEPAPQPVADGEVGELVAALRSQRADYLEKLQELTNESTGHPQPIPVSERLPGAGDCIRRGADDWCWGQERSLLTGEAASRWRLMRVSALVDEAVAWLPAHALPVPTND